MRRRQLRDGLGLAEGKNGITWQTEWVLFWRILEHFFWPVWKQKVSDLCWPEQLFFLDSHYAEVADFGRPV